MNRNIDQVDSMRARSALSALLVLCLSLSGIGGHAHAMATVTGPAGHETPHSEMTGMPHDGGHEMPGAMMPAGATDESCCQDEASCLCSAISQCVGLSNQTSPLHSVMTRQSPKTNDFMVDIVPPPPKLA